MTTAYSSEHLPNGYTTTANSSYTNGAHEPRPMDSRQGEYQPGLNSPQPKEDEHHSEGSSADHSTAAQYTPQQDVKYNATATPNSEYSLNPSSARSGTFPEYNNVPRTAAYPDGSQRYHPSAGPNGAGNMAQPTSPSMSPPEVPDGQTDNRQVEASNPSSDQNIPVDPSIAQSSPTYPPPHYPPYTPQHDMGGYHGQPMYRPDYPGPYSAPHMGYGHVPTSVSPPLSYPGFKNGGMSQYTNAYFHPQGGHPLSTVYSFVPIPGTHQQKRPRRRYEEIERMYKCGWNGCEKAYGTLNHLNAHVTMQSHGSKRTPEGMFKGRRVLSFIPCRTRSWMGALMHSMLLRSASFENIA